MAAVEGRRARLEALVKEEFLAGDLEFSQSITYLEGSDDDSRYLQWGLRTFHNMKLDQPYDLIRPRLDNIMRHATQSREFADSLPFDTEEISPIAPGSSAIKLFWRLHGEGFINDRYSTLTDLGLTALLANIHPELIDQDDHQLRLAAAAV